MDAFFGSGGYFYSAYLAYQSLKSTGEIKRKIGYVGFENDPAAVERMAMGFRNHLNQTAHDAAKVPQHPSDWASRHQSGVSFRMHEGGRQAAKFQSGELA